ncbi:MAG: AAA family ATPase [Candidatus Tectomicrobia bacterium]|nr:AAA family ATPase [Candidatus Tectomicrobia bacterium]
MSNEHGNPLRELLKLYNAAPDLGTKARRYQDLRAELNMPNLPDLTMLEDTPDAELLAKVSAILGIRPPQEPRKPVALNSIQENLPRPVLQAHGLGGAVLSEGTVCLLAGAGGVAKSTLALHIALGIAMAPNDGELHALHGKIFNGRGGPVLLVSFENVPGVLGWYGRKLAGLIDEGKRGAATEAMARVHVLDFVGYPLFGPVESHGAHYNTRPGPLPGWTDLWAAADRLKPRLVVIDPALSAFVGDSIGTAPVREFLDALVGQARERSLGVMVVAHSTKAARHAQASDPYDPGLVAGSAAWLDGVRGVLTMQREDSERALRIAKANYGPAFRCITLAALDHRDGREHVPVGFQAQGEWTVEERQTRGRPREDDALDLANPNGASRQHRTMPPLGQGGILADRDNPPV